MRRGRTPRSCSTTCPRISTGPPKNLDEALKQPLLLDDSAENFKAAAKKLNHGQKQQLLFDYSADAFKATIDIKPDYDFGNNNLGVYYARESRPDDLALAEKYFTRRLDVQPALCRRLQQSRHRPGPAGQIRRSHRLP